MCPPGRTCCTTCVQKNLENCLEAVTRISPRHEGKMVWDTTEDLLYSLRDGCFSWWWCFPLFLTQNNPINGMQIFFVKQCSIVWEALSVFTEVWRVSKEEAYLNYQTNFCSQRELAVPLNRGRPVI